MDSKNLQDRGRWTLGAVPSINATFRQCMDWVNTPGWSVLREGVISRFGGFSGVRSLEIGSGMGKTSMLFSLLGARASALDYNPQVIAEARRLHRRCGARTRFEHASALSLPARLMGRFDVSMSFGTCEHFDGAERRGVLQAHADVLRPGGFAFIWVPNKLGIVFQTMHGLYKLVKGWPIFERTFFRWELLRRGKEAGLCRVRVVAGSTLERDFDHLVRGEFVAALRKRLNRFRSPGLAEGGDGGVGAQDVGRSSIDAHVALVQGEVGGARSGSLFISPSLERSEEGGAGERSRMREARLDWESLLRKAAEGPEVRPSRLDTYFSEAHVLIGEKPGRNPDDPSFRRPWSGAKRAD